MSVSPLSTWKSTFEALPLVSDGSWTTNISDWCDSHTTSLATATGFTHGVPAFTFGKAAFKSSLDALSPEADQATAASNMAGAWEAGILASTYITLPGDSYLPGGQAFTFSVVATSLIDVPSIAVAKAQLITDLTNAALVDDAANSDYPKAFRDAFLALTVSVTGTNSLPIPLPIANLLVPLL